MTHFYHRGEHVDGVWFRLFKTREAALADVAKSLGYEPGDPDDRRMNRWVDDNGGTHGVDEAPAGITTAAAMLALERAYDARECGTATKAQIAKLKDVGW